MSSLGIFNKILQYTFQLQFLNIHYRFTLYELNLLKYVLEELYSTEMSCSKERQHNWDQSITHHILSTRSGMYNMHTHIP